MSSRCREEDQRDAKQKQFKKSWNRIDTRANQTLMHERIGGFRSRAGVVSGLQWRDDHEFIKTAIFRETNPRIFLLKPPFFSACLQGGDRGDRINPAVHVNNKHTSLIRRFLYSHSLFCCRRMWAFSLYSLQHQWDSYRVILYRNRSPLRSSPSRGTALSLKLARGSFCTHEQVCCVSFRAGEWVH